MRNFCIWIKTKLRTDIVILESARGGYRGSRVGPYRQLRTQYIAYPRLPPPCLPAGRLDSRFRGNDKLIFTHKNMSKNLNF